MDAGAAGTARHLSDDDNVVTPADCEVLLLWRRARAGDPYAQRTTVLWLHLQISRLLRRPGYRVPEHLREDLTQVAVARIWRVFARCCAANDSQLITWVHVVAWRAMLTELLETRRLHDPNVSFADLGASEPNPSWTSAWILASSRSGETFEDAMGSEPTDVLLARLAHYATGTDRQDPATHSSGTIVHERAKHAPALADARGARLQSPSGSTPHHRAGDADLATKRDPQTAHHRCEMSADVHRLLCRLAVDAYGELDDGLQESLWARLVGGETWRMVAADVRLAEGTAKQRVNRALARLRYRIGARVASLSPAVAHLILRCSPWLAPYVSRGHATHPRGELETPR